MLYRIIALVCAVAFAVPCAPARSAAAGGAPEGATLVLAGPSLDPARVNKAAASLARAGDLLLVPPVPAYEDPRFGAFLRDRAALAVIEAERAAAYRLGVRQLLRTHRLAHRQCTVGRVVGLYDGAETALILMRDRSLTPRHLILLDPDAEALFRVEPPATKDAKPAARLNIDIFVTRPVDGRTDPRAEALKQRLSKWGAVVRVYAADLRGRSLQETVAEMVWPLRGLRSVRIQKSGEQEIDRRALFRLLEKAQVVFVGEMHDNTAFHRFQLDLVRALNKQRGDLLLSLEMFERDVQPVLDRYLKGEISEAEFLAAARPWPNYTGDYRPIIEYCRQQKIPVLAANVPRRHARAVSRGGLEALDELAEEDRAHVAAEPKAASPAYRRRFAEVMRGMTGERLDRMYAAQCVKDDTMAESIHNYLEANPEIRRVVHLNGAFHSSYHLGTVNGLRARRPDVESVVVTCIPVDNPRAVDLPWIETFDDVLVFSPQPLPRPPRRRPGHPTMPKTKPMPKPMPKTMPKTMPPTAGKSAGSASGSAG